MITYACPAHSANASAWPTPSNSLTADAHTSEHTMRLTPMCSRFHTLHTHRVETWLTTASTHIATTAANSNDVKVGMRGIR